MPEGVTYAEVRSWAVWLQTFTARDLSGALHCDLAVARRGVKALLWHGICEVLAEDYPGPEGPEELIGYVPLPPGPREHWTDTPVEVVVAREMGGDPLHVVRGIPVAAQKKPDSRVGVGRRHTQGPAKAAEPLLVKQPKRRRNRHRVKQTDTARGSSNG